MSESEGREGAVLLGERGHAGDDDGEFGQEEVEAAAEEDQVGVTEDGGRKRSGKRQMRPFVMYLLGDKAGRRAETTKKEHQCQLIALDLIGSSCRLTE